MKLLFQIILTGGNKTQALTIKVLMVCNAQSEPGVDETGFGAGTMEND